jgi:hypothetical protein
MLLIAAVFFKYKSIYKDSFNTLYYNVLQAVYWFLLYFLYIYINI